MPISAADLGFMIDRGTGLVRRGLASLRTRGLRASWQRVLKQLRPVPAAQRVELFRPEPGPFAPFTVPGAAEPVASIVIPVYDQLEHTLECLRALAAHPPKVAVEIIVVDDGSTDATADCLPRVGQLRYLRRSANGGFIAACNDGAAAARGEYLVFLNNDTVPQPGWLDALLATFEDHPDTGLAGAQLLYPDGRLQEAGGIVFADGSGWNYGRFEAADAPPFAHPREVDYCSGAAIALPTELFRTLGGFDTRYAPAYYEDTDLAFAVRAHGLKVRYQPASRVLHLEGATSGTDTASGAKAHQVRNRAVFAAKWAQALQAQPVAGSDPRAAALSHYPRQVLVIDSLTPRPDRDSGSLRLVNLLKLLRDEGAHVVFMPADRGFDGAYTRALQQAGVEAWHAPYAAAFPAWLREHGHRFDTVLVCRHYVMRGMLTLLRRHAPQARLVFDTVDLHYLREQRAARVNDDPRAHRTAARTRALELDVIARSDATLVVSEAERELLAVDAPGADVHVLSNLHAPGAAGLPFAQRRDVMFVGGFRHPPNVDAVCWFVREVWPLVRRSEPALAFHCIGGDVPEAVRCLGDLPGVHVHGHVPDLAPWLAGIRVSVAPLRYGAGVKGKVNQSMAHGVPVVATGCAVEGMHLTDGVDVMVADAPDRFAEAVLALHRDGDLWHRLADNGRLNVERHFSATAARDVVQRVLLRRD
ncbi:glycosyl transferase [Lysobacter arseniciresistens ZS79]|uniref:Glycosyl transferase n=1 Tax=Lysobacter arseniciresistens ZS79 TaxID=913325 RepID=A0A0A0F226_9GAMM|nr:glycosyltransferase [Lysobacter arseniciresistens]KGM56625.1 glycosyl transferase [Lysobacter arseniciresistens ZS79]